MLVCEKTILRSASLSDEINLTPFFLGHGLIRNQIR
jgi:hypothetical protein